MTNRAKNLIFIYYIVDLIILTASFFLLKLVKYKEDPPEYILSIYFILVFIWILILVFNDSEKLYLRETFWYRMRKQIGNFMIFTGLVTLAIYVFQLGYYSRFIIFGTIISFFILKTITFLLIFIWIGYRRKRGRHLAKVLIVGAGRVGSAFYEFTKNNIYLGFNVIGFLDDYIDDKDCEIRDMVIGRVDEITGVLEKYDVDEVIIAIPLMEENLINLVVAVSDYHGKRIKLIPDFYRIFKRSYNANSLGGFPIINIREIPLDKLTNLVTKRLLDLTISIFGIILSLPLMVVIAVLIKLDSKGPLLYKPVRLSKGGKEFHMLKFRSMYECDSQKAGNLSTKKNDPRITKIGKWLRKSNMDELPQLFNVLINNMSLVGPRPHRLLLNFDLQHTVGGYMIRHYIKPGITGWAQVNGWRGPTDTPEQKGQRTKHDLWYIENWTFWLDIKILWMTFFSKKARHNAF